MESIQKTILTLILAITSISAFQVSHQTRAFGVQRTQSSTSLNVAPTMVIYWTIKTAFDSAAYALGMTDEVKGTGVWNSFELKREKDEDDPSSSNDNKSKPDDKSKGK